MSWGTSEVSFESTGDFHFDHAGVTFLAASGDTGHDAGHYPAALRKIA